MAAISSTKKGWIFHFTIPNMINAKERTKARIYNIMTGWVKVISIPKNRNFIHVALQVNRMKNEASYTSDVIIPVIPVPHTGQNQRLR